MKSLKGLRVEFHILQSFPTSCLNRDDVGDPKSVLIGGVNRARVSSQCWKRAVREQLREFGATIGIRTKLVSTLVYNACIKTGASEEDALKAQKFVDSIFAHKDKKANNKKTEKNKTNENPEEKPEENTEDDENNTLLFLSNDEIQAIADFCKDRNYNMDEKDKDLKKVFEKIIPKKGTSLKVNALDVALFGRMMAKADSLKVEGASFFSHAHSTHRVESDFDYFTAMDDISDSQGSAHIGQSMFNSATYYRYISLDLGMLQNTLQETENISEAVKAFVKALFTAIPSAKQNSMSASTIWDFARIYIRKGQNIQLTYDKPVYSSNGYSEESIARLKTDLDAIEKRTGSLFGKKAVFEFGGDDTSIDSIIENIVSSIEND